MVIKYNADIKNDAISNNIDKITNQVFKLLPTREEGEDWRTPLENLIVEVAGMASLIDDHINLFPLLCKMEGMLTLGREEDFFRFRKTIFECLGLIGSIKQCLD